ncbi:hypothetical protein ACB098_04G026400 [Castanea mollissima]
MEESASMEIQLATALINNIDQNTQEEADIPGGNENKNNELVIDIRDMLKRQKTQSSTQCHIYKVPHYLRKWNEEAYTPQVISIGPFHRKNERLKPMEENKEIILQESRGTEFVKMILVDVSFIIELLFRCSLKGLTTDDPMAGEPRADVVMLDLLLLENQLPFFVIEKLFNLAFPSLSNANPSLKRPCCSNIQSIQAHPNMKIERFTELLRTYQLPPPEEQPKRNPQLIKHLYSATQLLEAGVKFEVGSSICYFYIKFERVLKIPSVELNDMTEVVTRNIMTLEQTCSIKNAYFTDYIFFMDLLIYTKKDVDLLCDKKIMVNYLGDNNAATLMINNVNKGLVWATVRDDYINLCKELNKFYENPWHRMKATLKCEYFSTPWRTASTFAAIILLFLTFIQTIFFIIPAVKTK